MPPVKKPLRTRRPTFIRAWRGYRKLSQDRVAERIGISRENYGRIESGKVPYNQDFLEMCSVALNCTVSDLLEHHPTAEPEMDALRQLLASASDADKKRILAVAKTLLENNG